MNQEESNTLATGGKVRGGSGAPHTEGAEEAHSLGATRRGSGEGEPSCSGDEAQTRSDGTDASRRYTAIESFDDMELREELLRGVYTFGFERPSAIQQRAIRPMADMQDIIAQSQSGTGKTACFSIGILQNVDTALAQCQACILAPTRELAAQTEKVTRALGEYLQVSTYTVVGGASTRACIERLRAGVHVVVGTPGRTLDMMTRGVLDCSYLRYLVLDEADEMLSKGFKEQIYDIFQLLPHSTRVALFSATMPPEVLDLTCKFMAADAVSVLVKRELQTLDGIKQYYVNVQRDDHKFGTLCDLYGSLSITQAMIFVNTRSRVEWLACRMHELDFTVSAIHSYMPQDERTLIIQQFRSGAARVLITTDVLARGIDVQQVNLVINYDLPHDVSNYIHRIGRAGRFGRKGTAINLLTTNDLHKAREIENYYSTVIEELPRNVAEL
ncbi:hypothetical protein AB1Y20_004217 [Prymnesium parvum]|uniref:RNA helicase n=1 Tax=Prymnesium parvum TaxID=97485 RepID=A0AB34J7I6_PRYPA